MLTHKRIALGSVQFGMPYGIANHAGQVSFNEVTAILEHAWSAGLNTLDTAIVYGESEQRLGEIGVGEWQIISKLPAISESCTDVAAWVQKLVIGSLERLGVTILYGMLLHRSQQLRGPQGDMLYHALIELKDQGLVEKIGVSIYNPDELDALCPHFQFDLVQAPFNIMDRRLATSGWLKRLHQSGTEVHVRSVFLQGLLLMEAENRPATFNRWQPLWEQWDHWLANQDKTPLQACLGYVLAQPEINRAVVGIDSLKQLQEIFAAIRTKIELPPASLISEDLDLINPSNWSEL